MHFFYILDEKNLSESILLSSAWDLLLFLLEKPFGVERRMSNKSTFNFNVPLY